MRSTKNQAIDIGGATSGDREITREEYLQRHGKGLSQPIATTSSISFQDAWRDRCLNENAIALDVYEANIVFLEGQSLYEALNWVVSQK